jgi:vacuolar-type H+-ATPase subunit E/Vma4
MAERLPSQSPGPELLARAIIAQAQEEAEKIRQAARAEADTLIAEAEAEAARRRQVAVEEEKARALKEKSKALALAELEAHRLFLHAREELLERVFARTVEALATLREQPEYSGLLLQLVQEGMVTLAGEEFIVEVAPEDLSLAEQVRSSPAWCGKKLEVQAAEEVGGGCIVWRQDRSAFYDNRLVGILARQKEQLRPLIATWLFGREKYWQG